jgi:hypothetical protein
MQRLASVSLLVILPSSLAFAGIEVVRDPKSWDYAPLLYADRIVRGTIESTAVVGIPDTVLYPELAIHFQGWKISVLRVTMRVNEVLRGAVLPPGEEHVLIVFQPWNALYFAGSEMIVCEHYHAGLKAYYQAGQYGRYIRKRKNWVSEETPRGHRSFSDADMRAKIASMDLEHVASEAELVIDGDIDSVAWSEFYGPDSSSAQFVALRFKLRSVDKGTYAADEIEVRALGEGMYLPEWRKHIPRSFQVSQRWICFLRKNEIGWYPFAGTNGLFRVDGDSLIYDERVNYWHSPDQVREAVRRAGEADR